MDERRSEGQQPFDGRLVGGKLRGRRMHDVVDEVAAAIGVVADEGTAGRQIGVNGDQAVVDAVGAKPLQDDLAEGVVAHRADEDRAAAAARRLVDEDARRAARIGARVGAEAPVAAALVGADKLDEKLADRGNCDGHGRRLPEHCITPLLGIIAFARQFRS